MIIKQLMPSLSPTMEEGTLIAWHIKEGDAVKPGQVMAEIQTDKAVVEWECLDAGTCRKLIIGEGENAKVNMVAAIFTTKDEDIEETLKEAEEINAGFVGGAAAEPEAASEPLAEEVPQAVSAPTAPAPVAAPTSAPLAAAPAPEKAVSLDLGKRRISPVAARLAAEHGVSLDDVEGSGTDGRIIRRDIENYIAKGAPKSKSNPFMRQDGPQFTDVPMTTMRQVIGKRLLESKQQLPHFYVTEVIRCDAMVALRKQLNAVDGVKISFNDLVTKAVALNLVRFPGVNATFDGQTIREWHQADISIAVAIPDGLITPIVPQAERLTLSELSASIKTLAKKAMAGKLQPHEFQGGSFTISNLGMYGIEEFNAIINPPQAAILAVGGIKDEPVVENGEVVPGKTMRLTLSADHRVIDGALAAEFMAALRQTLEAPATLML